MRRPRIGNPMRSARSTRQRSIRQMHLKSSRRCHPASSPARCVTGSDTCVQVAKRLEETLEWIDQERQAPLQPEQAYLDDAVDAFTARQRPFCPLHHLAKFLRPAAHVVDFQILE